MILLAAMIWQAAGHHPRAAACRRACQHQLRPACHRPRSWTCRQGAAPGGRTGHAMRSRAVHTDAPGGAARTLTNSRSFNERLRLFYSGGRGHRASCASDQARSREDAMTGDNSRRIEVKDEDQTIAAAEVTPVDDSEGTVRSSFLPSSGPAPPGSRASLVDAVMDLPEVQESSRVEATVPLCDAESPKSRLY